MKNKLMSIGFQMIELFLFGIFVYAVFVKVVNFDGWKIVFFQTDYTTAIDILKIGPFIIPFLEIVFASMILTIKYKKSGFYGIIFLMTSYSLHIIYRLFIAKDHDCSCMGIFKAISFLQHFYVSLSIIILSILSLFYNNGRKINN
jgi:hypothetical protein